MDRAGRRPLGTCDTLGAFRGTARHDVRRAGRVRCRFERACARVDPRYALQRPRI
jgi:hypothetical protein